MAPWTRITLVCLLAATALGLIFALAYIRRLRRGRGRLGSLARVPMATPPPPLAVGLKVRSVLAATRGRELGSGSAGLAIAAPEPVGISGRVGCPTCRREFEAGARFCTYDARRLVPVAEVAARSRVAGTVCPRCRRAFEAGLRACAYDSEELMAMPLWEATHGRRDGSPTGCLAKICPQCAVRYDLAMSFCGRDGAELSTIN